MLMCGGRADEADLPLLPPPPLVSQPPLPLPLRPALLPLTPPTTPPLPPLPLLSLCCGAGC